MKGFTLIELLIVMLIFLIIMASVFAVLSMGKTSWYTGNTQVEVQGETRRGMDFMTRELYESASSKVSITTGTEISFQIPIDEDTIDVTVDDDVLDTNGNIEWGAEETLGWSIEYSLSNGQILRKVFNNDDPAVEQISYRRVLANNITALSFSSVASVVSIGITAQKNTAQGFTMQSTLSSQIRLRN